MAKVRFKRAQLEKHFKLDEKTLERINLFGTPAEKVGEEIEVEIFPNRPDLLSLYGFVRAINAFMGKNTGIKNYKVAPSNYQLKVDKTVPAEWPYAYACVVKGLALDDQIIREIIQIQEKVGSTLLRNRKKGGIGVYPLDKITFPVTFKGMAPEKIKFRPLEYPDEISGKQILTKHPTGKEYGSIIENWKTFPVFVDSTNKIMSMPPIINAYVLGRVDTSTKDVFVEVTGNDAEAVKLSLIIMATSLAEMGGKIHAVECIQHNGSAEKIPNLTPTTHKVSLENVEKLLGIKLKEKEVENLLARMQLEYKAKKVQVPAWRNDILHEVDIIEDIAIAYGYERFQPIIPNIATVGEVSREYTLSKKCVEALTGLGFLETSSMHFITNEEGRKINVKKPLLVENARTEYKILRPNLLVPMLRTLSENTDAEYPQKLCEIGTIFKEDPATTTGIKEATHLIFAIAPGNYTALKQAMDYISATLNLPYQLAEATAPGFIDGRCVSIAINNKAAGYMGEVHPDTLAEWKIKMPLAIAEIDLKELFSHTK